MLIEFTVGNFLSFKDKVTFSMVAINRLKNKQLEDNLFEYDKNLTLLKSAVIYGANASGKSNLIKAINFVIQFINDSLTITGILNGISATNFRLSEETENQPSFFEIVFIQEDIQYRYGFEVYGKEVHKEWLYYIPNIKEIQLYERTNQDFKLHKNFKEGRRLEEKTQEEVLFLSVVTQFNGKISRKIMDWFVNFNAISGITDESYKEFAIEQLKNKQKREKILHYLKNLDTAIENIDIMENYIMPKDSPMILSFHKKYFANGSYKIEQFNLKTESEGTKKLLYILAPIIATLEYGYTLVIDELDARFHPLITRFIIELFHSPKSNPKNAQLIFATHDTNLLSNKYFRRDQIYFTEKTKFEATKLYSLAEFKIKVRNDASYEKDYIQGKYGAIPYLGSIDDLFGDDNEKE